MNELMQQWKASGTAGKETDDELWDAFNAARQKFFDRKHEHWENLQHWRILLNGTRQEKNSVR